MARYVERTENLARILDVNETFSRDSQGAQNWLSVLQLYDDEDRFLEHHDEADGTAVIRFYLLDREHPGSIVSTVRMARENARTLRPLISTEMWNHLNTFHNRLRELTPEDASAHRLARLCAFVKEGCQTHTGITEGTFFRDAGWNFYQMGRMIERADQTTRLLDVKYHLLLPSVADVGSPVDVSQWNALLRSASAYHAFRRVHPSGLDPAAVASFLLFNHEFPRSVAACVGAFGASLERMRDRYKLSGGVDTVAATDVLAARLGAVTIDRVIAKGLHQFVDATQLELIGISAVLGREFFP